MMNKSAHGSLQEKQEKQQNEKEEVNDPGLSRVAVIGPFAALLAVPTALVPQDLGGLATVFFTSFSLLIFGIVGSYTGIPLLSNAADAVIDRTIHVRRNWENDTLRSFLEVLSWLFVTFEIHMISNNVLISASVGALIGFGLVAVGDALTSLLRTMEQRISEDVENVKFWKFGKIATPELVASVAVLIFGVILRLRDLNTVMTALTTTSLASLSLVILGQVFMKWEPTHRVGVIVQDRLVNLSYNWQAHTFRSCFETSAWLAATWKSYAVLEDTISSGIIGAVAGLFICVVGEVLLTTSPDNWNKQHQDQLVFQQIVSEEKKQLQQQLKKIQVSRDQPSILAAATIKKQESNVYTDTVPMVWREQEGIAGKYPRYYPSPLERKAQKELIETQSAKGNIDSKEPHAEIYKLPQFNRKDVAKHNTREDAWVIIDERVYDITSYVNSHPGGWLPMSHLVGKDATDAFLQYHPAHVYKLILPRLLVGELVAEEQGVSEFVHDMRLVYEELLRMGLFETSRTYYILKICWLASLFAASIICVAIGSSFKTQVIVSSLLMGLFWQQLAFLGHDLGHNSVSHVMKTDAFWGGLFGNALGGIALSWWRRNHNTHHVICNSVEHDPDIQHPPIFAVSDKIFAKPFWSTYYEKTIQIDEVFRALVSKQHWLFYPVMMLARFNLYVQSWILLLSPKKVLYRKSQLFSMLMFPLWVGFLLYSLDSVSERIAWLLISHAFAGILHVQICISHFPMDHFHGEAYTGRDTDEWYRLQLRTTMDVICPEYLDWFHGGLQFQVEHHMFPRLPRHSLRFARDLVKRVCLKHNVEYHEAPFIEANKLLLSSMRCVAEQAKSLKKGVSGFYESQLWEGMNAIG